jgi:hypothetical protein|tara:strand:+ start:3474 stop:3737 length:264 start_codon:yes stop_codon:yes gene_type:complete
MELKAIDEAQKEAEKFFEREDVKALFHEACRLSIYSLPDYQVGKTLWKRMGYKAPHPSKQKRDELKKVERDLYHVACALNRRGGYAK